MGIFRVEKVKDYTTISNYHLRDMIFAMMPFFALGLYEKNGEPLEAVLRHIIESRYLRPRRRIYQTQNIYALLEKQAQLENEVKAIAQGKKQKAHRKRKAAD